MCKCANLQICGCADVRMCVKALLGCHTIPPLRRSYRGFGELDVGITHSFALVLSGYIFQGGNLGDPYPWWLSLPLFLSILPSITLAGIQDYEADKRAGKKRWLSG